MIHVQTYEILPVFTQVYHLSLLIIDLYGNFHKKKQLGSSI